jgi:acyl-CoA synthetase (AMP-forming)/AMP-acid ligase II
LHPRSGFQHSRARGLRPYLPYLVTVIVILPSPGAPCRSLRCRQHLSATFYAAAYDAGPRPSRLLKDVGTLIFTSGTSGKPKAVAVKNFLLVVVSTPFIVDAKNVARYLPLRTFSCLPLFHTTCLFTGLYYSTGLSGSFYLARKFSASRFTAQLVESGATRMLYVGELCRYLVARPPSSFDQAHRCIVTLGNGLRRDVRIKFH